MARVNLQNRENTYRTYITDALMYIAENTSKRVGGTYLNKRYADIINPQKPTDTRSGSEIASDIINRISRRE